MIRRRIWIQTRVLGSTLEYRFERRPDQRDINTLCFAYKRDIDSGIIELSLRRSEDDWTLDSTTVEFRYRHYLGGQAYFEPHLRFYRQSQAEFFRHSLITGQTLPAYASADTRLASVDAMTVGLKYGTSEREKSHYGIGVE